jgi:hypothetical protein
MTAWTTVAGVDRFWSDLAGHFEPGGWKAGKLIGWSPTDAAIEIAYDRDLALGRIHQMAAGGPHLVVLFETKAAHTLVVIDARDGRIVAKRGWGPHAHGDQIVGVAISATGDTIAHGDRKTGLEMWKVARPEDGFPPPVAAWGAPCWVSDAMDCLAEYTGRAFAFYSCKQDSAQHLVLDQFRHAACWSIAPDLSVAVADRKRRMWVSRRGHELDLDVGACKGAVAAGAGGRIAARMSWSGQVENVRLHVRGEKPRTLASAAPVEAPELLFSPDGGRLAAVHATQVEIWNLATAASTVHAR